MSELVMEVEIIDIKWHVDFDYDSMGVIFQAKNAKSPKCKEPFIVYFDALDESLNIGDQMIITFNLRG